MGCGLVLVPWPNRVAGARWPLDGRPQLLDVTEPSRGNASHGLLRNTGYRIVSGHRTRSVCAPTFFRSTAIRSTWTPAVEYRLTDDGPAGHPHRGAIWAPERAPLGVGAHPYLRIGDVPSADLTVTIAADTMVTVDDRQIPVERVPVDGTRFDLRRGAAVGGLGADTGFTDLTPAAGGRFEHRRDGTRRAWADAVDRPGFRVGAGVHPGQLPGARAPGVQDRRRHRTDDLRGGRFQQRLGPAVARARRNLVRFVGSDAATGRMAQRGRFAQRCRVTSRSVA